MLKTRTSEEIKNEMQMLGESYIDAETENADYMDSIIKQIKNIYKNGDKISRDCLKIELQKLGLACTYYKNNFKIFYID